VPCTEFADFNLQIVRIDAIDWYETRKASHKVHQLHGYFLYLFLHMPSHAMHLGKVIRVFLCHGAHFKVELFACGWLHRHLLQSSFHLATLTLSAFANPARTEEMRSKYLEARVWVFWHIKIWKLKLMDFVDILKSICSHKIVWTTSFENHNLMMTLKIFVYGLLK